MTVLLDEDIIKVDIDNVTEWYKELKEFFEYVSNIIEPREDDY